MSRSSTSTRGGAGLRGFHSKSIKGLAWASFVIALAAGALLPATFVGDLVRGAFGFLPAGWNIAVPVIILIVGWGAVFLDCYLDLEPNQVAVYGALMLPTVATSISGGLATWTIDLAQSVLGRIDGLLFQAVPNGMGATALAVAVSAAVLFMSNRVVKKTRKG
jgi:hypothetical protein